MAEKIISPGVFTKENDLSFVQQGIGAIGAAVIGPTVKGPANVPTTVFSYSDFATIFGESFKSGSGTKADFYQYYTSIAAKDYLKHGGPLTVVRILDTGYSNATASWHAPTASQAETRATANSSAFTGGISDGDQIYYTGSDGTIFTFICADAPIPANVPSANVYYFNSGSNNPAGAGGTLSVLHMLAATMSLQTGDTIVSSSLGGLTLNVTASVGDGSSGNNIHMNFIGTFNGTVPTFTSPTNGVDAVTGIDLAVGGIPTSASYHGTGTHIGGIAHNLTASFNLKTIGDGLIMNSTPTTDGGVTAHEGPNGILTTGSVQYGTKDNLRWEVVNVNESKGTFTVVIRRGDDTNKRKVVLETWNGCMLDPKSNAYIGKMIGTAYNTVGNAGQTDIYIQPQGNYPNKSKFVYVDEASILKTPMYLDENGNKTDASYTASLPQVSSGSFGGGADGTVAHPRAMYETISTTNVQGITFNGVTGLNQKYTDAIQLLANQDEYDINLLFLPGINDQQHNGTVTKIIEMCEERGDLMAIIDPVAYGQTIAAATGEAADRDSSYAAYYWPWVQIADPVTGRYIWAPQSVVMPGIYAFNDKVSAEWFAPAGLNRGGQETVVQAERKLTHSNRDELYDASVNPVATFPGEGVCVWGQKTLQKKASALDRVNVRRLLINLKKFIASVSKYLIFENNTSATRNRFLSQVNPYMESVQQRQGLYAFKVVMDESNNTPDIIDRNIMKGDKFIQPAKAAEFIVIDFNVMPTGATFND